MLFRVLLLTTNLTFTQSFSHHRYKTTTKFKNTHFLHYYNVQLLWYVYVNRTKSNVLEWNSHAVSKATKDLNMLLVW